VSWTDAKRDAAAIQPLKQAGRRVFMPDFQDQAALDLFAPQHGWRLKYYQMVFQASLREHKRAGLKIIKVKIASADYLAWLHGRADSPELRAGFTAALLAAETTTSGPRRVPASG
jgi:hypothetical protein